MDACLFFLLLALAVDVLFLAEPPPLFRVERRLIDADSRFDLAFLASGLRRDPCSSSSSESDDSDERLLFLDSSFSEKALQFYPMKSSKEGKCIPRHPWPFASPSSLKSLSDDSCDNRADFALLRLFVVRFTPFLIKEDAASSGGTKSESLDWLWRRRFFDGRNGSRTVKNTTIGMTHSQRNTLNEESLPSPDNPSRPQSEALSSSANPLVNAFDRWRGCFRAAFSEMEF